MKLVRNIRVVVFVSLMYVPFISTAQFTIGADVGFVKYANFEPYLGGGISAKYFLSEDFRVGMTAGLYQAPPFEVGSPYAQEMSSVFPRIIPVSLNAEYLFLKNRFRPYLGAQVGLMRLNNRIDNALWSRSCLNLAPVLGVEYQVSERVGINVNVKYNSSFYKDYFQNEIKYFSTFNANLGVFYKL